ncbi:hypothetical protein NHX12_003393, partial [Muraenolepis orangiensis]
TLVGVGGVWSLGSLRGVHLLPAGGKVAWRREGGREAAAGGLAPGPPSPQHLSPGWGPPARQPQYFSHLIKVEA